MDWFYEKNGEQKGPVSQEELATLILNGDIQPNDLVWNNTFGDIWKKLEEVQEFHYLLPEKDDDHTDSLTSDTIPESDIIREQIPIEEKENKEKKDEKEEKEEEIPKYRPPSEEDIPLRQTQPKLDIVTDASKFSPFFKGLSVITIIGGLLYLFVTFVALIILIYFAGFKFFPILMILTQILFVLPIFVWKEHPRIFDYTLGFGIWIGALTLGGQLGIPQNAELLVELKTASIRKDIDALKQKTDLSKLQWKLANAQEDKDKDKIKEIQKEIEEIHKKQEKEAFQKELNTLNALLDYVEEKDKYAELRLKTWQSLNGFELLGVFLIILGVWYHHKEKEDKHIT